MRNILEQWHARTWPWFITHAESPYALAWLALVGFADAVFFPIATELFLVALMLAQPARWRSFLIIGIGSSTIGAVTGYYIAKLLFVQFGMPILVFYHLQSAFDAARHFIMGHVFWAMAVASFTPVPDKVFIYAGGFLSAAFLPFIAGYFLGRGARMAIVVYLTGRYGAEVLTLINRYLMWFAVLLVILGTIYAVLHFM
ncbi:MAG: hypothetical protein V4474_02475 [Patescibacteria group bacterium]